MPGKGPNPQLTLLPIFYELQQLLSKYTPPLTTRAVAADKPQYHLSSFKDVIIAGRKRKEVYFAGAIVQKGYVGFYYMPAYAEPKIKKLLPPEMLKLLRGRSCFHIKVLTPQLKKQIATALKAGFLLYKQRDWV